MTRTRALVPIVALIALAGSPLAAAPASVADTNQAIERQASALPRGLLPRGFSGEQPYWTLVAPPEGGASGLISEDGAVEIAKGGVSVEPFVAESGRLITWADASPTQTLREGYLPMPSVLWRRRGWTLRVTAFAAGRASDARLVTRYEIRNSSRRPEVLTLGLAVRPFQVDGPEQFLNAPGGFSPIGDLSWNGTSVVVNGRPRLNPWPAPDRFAALSSNPAGIGPLLFRGSGEPSAHDANGMASGLMEWRLALRPGQSATVGWVAPLGQAAPPPHPSAAWAAGQEDAAARAWKDRLNRVTFTAPPARRAALDALKTSLAYMLASRDGPTLRPGTRSCDRSWIRDGAMISEALLRLGQADVAADYLRWYARFAYEDGRIPCCVDFRGADPTPENDSEGEFIFLAAEVWRYTGDRALLTQVWPRVRAAAATMDRLRLSERSPANLTPDRRMLHGLMPPSISHEGYSSKPAYSYWDDFWTLRGFEDAAFLAGVIGDAETRARLARTAEDFRADLLASIVATAAAHHIDFIAGAADLGDFDATSTTIALAPGDNLTLLPPTLVNGTFDRYWREFLDRRDGRRDWDAYTPYELRLIGAFTRLGQRDRAGALLDYFLADRRPLAWNGWAEVVGRDPRKPRFIGDMPHAWVASDYARSVIDMFAYARRDGAVVLGAGLPPAWFEGPGVGVAGLRTPWGTLDWSAKRRGRALVLRIAGSVRPPGGYVFPWPFAGAPPPAYLGGRALAWSAGALHLAGPGEVVIDGPKGAAPAP